MRKAYFLLVLLVVPVGQVRAQGNYQPYILGLRTAGMGGAATAFGRDSAMTWVNPAGIARAGADTLSLSANVYMIDQTDVYEFWTLGEEYRLLNGLSEDSGRSEIHSRTVSVFPSSMAYFLQLDSSGDHMLALSVMVPYQGRFDKRSDMILSLGSVRMKSEYQEIRSTTYYEIGPSYSLRLGVLSLGLSAFFRYVPIELDQFSDSILFSTMLGEAVFSPQVGHARGYSYDLDFVAGAQLGPVLGGLYAGLSLHSPSVHLGDSLKFDGFGYHAGRDVDTGEGDFSISFSALGDNSIEMRTPFWLSFGLGYEKPGSFAIAADVSYHLPYTYTSQSGSQEYTLISSQPIEGEAGSHVATRVDEFETRDERNGVLNVNLGAEVYLSSRLVMRAGFFTDFSNKVMPSTEELTKNDTGVFQVDRYGGTFGLAYSGSSSQFQAAFMFLGGLGNIIGWQIDGMAPGGAPALSYPLREIASNTYMFVFSGQIDTGVIFSKAKNAVLEEYHRARSQPEAKDPPAPVTKQAPVPAPESAQEPEPAKAPEPAQEPEPAKAPEPAKEPEPAKAPEPARETAPPKEPEPASPEVPAPAPEDDTEFEGWEEPGSGK